MDNKKELKPEEMEKISGGNGDFDPFKDAHFDPLKVFRCYQCDFTTTDMEDLVKHIDSHFANKPK